MRKTRIKIRLKARRHSMSSAKEVYDHMGNYFSSLSGMCKYWGISPDLYLKRLSRGW